MSDLTRCTIYRINENYHDKTKFRFVENAIDEGLLFEVVPDSTLQDIAKAWKAYRDSAPGSDDAALALHKVHSLVEGI